MTGFEPATAASFEQTGTIQTRVGFDAIELLPGRAAERLRALRQRIHDLNMLIPKFEDRNEASTARIQAEARLARLQAHQQHGGFNLRPDDPRVIEQQRLLDKLTDDQRRVNELYEVRSAAWREASHTLSAVESWLKDGGVPPGVVLQDCDGVEPKLLKNEGILDAIERLRRRGRELEADAHRTRSAPFPSSHVRAKIAQEIAMLAQRGQPTVSDAIEHDRSVVWPMQRLQGSIIHAQAPSFAVTEVPDLLGLFAFVHGAALLKALDALVDDEKDDAAALSHTEREKRLSEVEQDQLAAEYDESWFVWRAMHERQPCEHRADCAPQAILQCRLATAPRVDATGTTPGYSWDLRR